MGGGAEATAEELRDCSFTTPNVFDTPEVLRQLYGGPFLTARHGKGAIVVLGNHNSGTSMLTRLIMLMGAFLGSLNAAPLPSRPWTAISLLAPAQLTAAPHKQA